MAYRAPDPDASAARELEEEQQKLEAERLHAALRKADFRQFSKPRPGPAQLSSVVARVILLFPLPVLATAGGCYAGEKVSDHLSTVGDMAGGLEVLTAGGAIGMAVGWLAAWMIWRRSSRSIRTP